MINQLTHASFQSLRTIIQDPIGIAKKTYNLINGKFISEKIAEALMSENHLPGKILSAGINNTAEYIGKVYLAKYIENKIYAQLDSNFDFYFNEILSYLNNKSIENLNERLPSLKSNLDHFLYLGQSAATFGSVLIAKTQLLNKTVKQPLLNALKGRIHIPLNALSAQMAQKIGKIILKSLSKQIVFISASSLIASQCSAIQLLKGTECEDYANYADTFFQTATSWKTQLVFLALHNYSYGVRPLTLYMKNQCNTIKDLLLIGACQKLQKTLLPWLQSIDNPVIKATLLSMNRDEILEGLINHLSTLLTEKILPS